MKIEPLRAGFRRPLGKKYPFGGQDNFILTFGGRDDFILNQKIKYFLLVGFKKKLKCEFLAKLYAKQYEFRLKLGHLLACKIICNQRKKILP